MKSMSNQTNRCWLSLQVCWGGAIHKVCMYYWYSVLVYNTQNKTVCSEWIGRCGMYDIVCTVTMIYTPKSVSLLVHLLNSFYKFNNWRVPNSGHNISITHSTTCAEIQNQIAKSCAKHNLRPTVFSEAYKNHKSNRGNLSFVVLHNGSLMIRLC